MNRGHKVLAFVMAGGEGTRLRPLTTHRCKPAVPFGGHHHVIDFVLSNLVNSQICAIHVLVQYKSQSLIEHVCRAWATAQVMPHHFVSVVPPQMHAGTDWFQGTADAVSQNLHLIEDFQPDIVAVFGADHVYRMNVRHMLRFHVDARADVTVATLPVPLAESSQFGICEVDSSRRIRCFTEKPSAALPMPGRAGHALASMGNYLFSTDALLAGVRAAQANGGHDFGKDVLPAMVGTHRIAAYDFTDNHTPGLQPFEETGYWRDVGTIDAYFNAHLDTLGPTPAFCMTNPHWPIHAGPDEAESAQIEGGSIRRSTIGAGSMILDAQLDHAVLRRSVSVATGAQLDHCLVMERSVIGAQARIRRAIIDQDNHIPSGEMIGFDLEHDRKRFTVSPEGVVVVPRRHYPPPQRLANSHRAPSRAGRL